MRRWGRQLDGSRNRDLPDADELLRRLPENVPDGEPAVAIVHGDYRLDNLLVAERPGAGVIDWEMSTLGDPLTDVALLLVYDRLSEVAGGSAVADASSAPGYPDPDEQLEQVRRGQRTRPGPDGLPHSAWPTSSSP